MIVKILLKLTHSCRKSYTTVQHTKQKTTSYSGLLRGHLTPALQPPIHSLRSFFNVPRSFKNAQCGQRRYPINKSVRVTWSSQAFICCFTFCCWDYADCSGEWPAMGAGTARARHAEQAHCGRVLAGDRVFVLDTRYFPWRPSHPCSLLGSRAEGEKYRITPKAEVALWPSQLSANHTWCQARRKKGPKREKDGTWKEG